MVSRVFRGVGETGAHDSGTGLFFDPSEKGERVLIVFHLPSISISKERKRERNGEIGNNDSDKMCCLPLLGHCL